MTPIPSVTIGLAMGTIVAIAKTAVLLIEIVLRTGLAVALILASPFLLALIGNYQEYPGLAFMAGGIALWLFARIFLPRRYQ